MTAPVPTVDAPPVLTEEQLRALTEARAGYRKIRTAIGVATFDAWSLAIFGALTLVCGFTSATGVLVGLGLCAVAFVEFQGRAMLRRLDPRAARALGFNQLALSLILILYASWCIYSEFTGPGMFAVAGNYDPMVAKMLEPYKPLARQITLLVYGTLIAVAVFAQGGTALYYFTREKHIRDYASRTPEWILQMFKVGINLV